jgi:DNA-binding NtrC family response regulator
MLALRPESRYQNYDELLRDLRAIEGNVEKMTATTHAPAAPGLEGFPPGAPRVMIVHQQEKLHGDLKSKLEKRGYQVVCNVDLGRAVMLHEMKPFHAFVIDLETTGRDGPKAFVKQSRKGRDKLAGVFLAANPDQASWAENLNVDLVETLAEQPMTLTHLRKALAKLLPGVDSADKRAD